MGRKIRAATGERGISVDEDSVLSSGQETVVSDTSFSALAALVTAGRLIDLGAATYTGPGSVSGTNEYVTDDASTGTVELGHTGMHVITLTGDLTATLTNDGAEGGEVVAYVFHLAGHTATIEGVEMAEGLNILSRYESTWYGQTSGSGGGSGGGGGAWTDLDTIDFHDLADGTYLGDGTTHTTTVGGLVLPIFSNYQDQSIVVASHKVRSTLPTYTNFTGLDQIDYVGKPSIEVDYDCSVIPQGYLGDVTIGFSLAVGGVYIYVGSDQDLANAITLGCTTNYSGEPAFTNVAGHAEHTDSQSKHCVDGVPSSGTVRVEADEATNVITVSIGGVVQARWDCTALTYSGSPNTMTGTMAQPYFSWAGGSKVSEIRFQKRS